MSIATKRKQVQYESRQDFFAPPSEEQSIVKILESRGNNLHEVESADGEKYLASMPVKFRKNIWVKRGDFVLVEPINEGNKVRAEMVRVLSNVHIKYYKKINVWPSSFVIDTENRQYNSTTSESSTESSDSSEEDEEDGDGDDDDDGETDDGENCKEFIIMDDIKVTDGGT